MKQQFKQLVDYAWGKEHMTARTIRSTRLSSILNAVLALGKIGLGIYSLSLFVCVSGLYNVGIAFAKHTTVQNRDTEQQHKNYKRIGIIILVTSVVYMIYCANMAIRGKANVTYDLITALTIATFTFTEIGLAAYGMGAARKSKNLTIMAAKRINLVTALISLVLTESALLGLESTPNAANYCGWTGLIAGTVSVVVGLHMVITQGRQKSKKNSDE
jgi:hypothetical protein